MAGEKDLGNLTDNGIVGISISGTGKVGINTTTSTQLIDVNGNMNMSKCILIEHFDQPKVLIIL